jgi:hypothetical protein
LHRIVLKETLKRKNPALLCTGFFLLDGRFEISNQS